MGADHVNQKTSVDFWDLKSTNPTNDKPFGSSGSAKSITINSLDCRIQPFCGRNTDSLKKYVKQRQKVFEDYSTVGKFWPVWVSFTTTSVKGQSCQGLDGLDGLHGLHGQQTNLNEPIQSVTLTAYIPKRKGAPRLYERNLTLYSVGPMNPVGGYTTTSNNESKEQVYQNMANYFLMSSHFIIDIVTSRLPSNQVGKIDITDIEGRSLFNNSMFDPRFQYSMAPEIDPTTNLPITRIRGILNK